MSLRALLLDRIIRRSIATSTTDVSAEVERRRRDGSPAPAAVPASTRKRLRVEERTTRDHPVVTLKHRKSASQRALIYLPGGGYAHPISSSHWTAIARFATAARLDAIVPLYEVAPLSHAIEAHAFVEAVLESAVAEYGAGNVSLGGDSAGAGLALSVLQRLPVGVRSAVLVNPWLDVEISHPATAALEAWDVILKIDELREWGRIWADGIPTNDPAVSPLRGSFHGLPPVHIITGGRDLLLPDAFDAHRLLRAAGNSGTLTYAPDANHAVGLMGPATPESKRARTAIIAALAA